MTTLLHKFISDQNQILHWDSVRKFILLNPHSNAFFHVSAISGGDNSKEATNSVSANTLFLTEHGVIELLVF